MDLDLDLFDRDRDRSHRRRPRDDRRSHRRDDRWRRRDHPHVFSWVLLAGGVLLLAIAAMVIASSLGLWGAVADGYFAVTTAVLPAAWHDEWLALPGIAHVGIVLGALFVASGVLGEVFD